MNPKQANHNHISVCICSYKRPQMLAYLLGSLQHQITDNDFTYSVVVVDNDANQSARDTVKEWQTKQAIQIEYVCEPEQNIALARNKAVEKAKGNLVAFIDDDEFPESTWLTNLIKTQRKYKADGVLGPVKPYFEVEPPQWIIKSRICERASFPTGRILKKPSETRTGNVLLSKELFRYSQKPFNPEFGLTGGEDVDFFSRMIKKGLIFVWCNEAIVNEVVPEERFKKKYYLKRALMRGFVNSKRSSLFRADAVKSTMAIIIYTTTLPFFLILGQHVFMKYLIKNCDHIGKITGLLGFNIKTER